MHLREGVFAAIAATLLFAAPAAGKSVPTPQSTPAPAAQSFRYVVRYDHWTDQDEKDFSEFIQAIGDSQCRTVDSCLHGAWNPFGAGDPDDVYFHSDCAELPYVLRAYFA